MKKFLFLLVAIPLSAESMEKTKQGLHLLQRRNAQRPPLRPLPRLEEETTLAVLQLAEGGRSQSPVNQESEYDNAQKEGRTKKTITEIIADLHQATGATETSYRLFLPQGQPLELVVVVQPTKGPMRFELTPAQRKQNQDDSNDRDEEDQDCCKEVAAACDRMANIVGYLTAGFGAVVAANYLMQQIQENHAKIE